jgi:hypothetical protein
MREAHHMTRASIAATAKPSPLFGPIIFAASTPQ